MNEVRQAQHTPAPWIADEEEGTPYVTWEKPDHAYQMVAVMSLCTVNGIAAGQAEMRANARLIAAAPELLESLAFLRDCEMYRTDFAEAPEFERARAAIAKATGGAL